MFLVFLVVLLAGSLGAIHYVIVHILLRRPFGDEPPAAHGGLGMGGEAPSASGGGGPGRNRARRS